MNVASADQRLAERLGKLEQLLPEIEHLPDAPLREKVREIVETLLDFHGEALSRIVRSMEESGPPGRKLLEDLLADELVGSLLLLHGLHPRDLAARIEDAIERIRPLLGSHGGSVTLVRISPAGEVFLRLEGNCHGCASSQATLKSTIEQALYAAAPDLTAIHVEGVAEAPAAGGFVSLGALTATAEANRP